MNAEASASTSFRIDAWEWTPTEAGTTVTVTGRWRRQRPAGEEPLHLVLKVREVRHRFAPMEGSGQPTDGPAAGWTASFALPLPLSPAAVDRAWLEVGAVLIPLSISAGIAPVRSREASSDVSPQLLAERRLHAAELALETARAEALDADARRATLARQFERVSAELEGARRSLRERETARRLAEQREHAERAVRLELQEEVAALSGIREAAAVPRELLAEAERRVAELEREGERLTRRLAESEQLIGAAQAGRRHAEAELAARTASSAKLVAASDPRAEVLRREARLQVGEVVHAVARPAGPSPQRTGELARERGMIAARTALGQGGWSPSASAAAGGPLSEVLRSLGAELATLRDALGREREARDLALERAAAADRRLRQQQQRSGEAHAALGQLREELTGLRLVWAAGPLPWAADAPPAVSAPTVPESAPTTPGSAPTTPAPAPDASGESRSANAPELDPTRLDAALHRLRRPAPATVLDPARPASDWLARAFGALAREDPADAGRLALALLPSLALGDPGPLRVELDLLDAGVVCVAVAGDGSPVRILAAGGSPDAGQVDVTFRGDVASLARCLAAGSPRRRPFGGRGRMDGRRESTAAFVGLVHRRLALRELLASGVTLDARQAVRLAARAIDPALTRGHRFAIAFTDGRPGAARILLQVADGGPPSVLEGAHEAPQATEVVLADGEVAALLAGSPGPEPEIRGDADRLALVQRWLELAQSG